MAFTCKELLRCVIVGYPLHQYLEDGWRGCSLAVLNSNVPRIGFTPEDAPRSWTCESTYAGVNMSVQTACKACADLENQH